MWEHRRVSTLMTDILSRSAATLAGLLLFAMTTISLMRTVVIPRTLRSLMSSTVSATVIKVAFGLARLRKSYDKRDSILAWVGPTILVLQLITWLVFYLFAYGLLLYGVGGQDVGDSLRQAGSSLFTLGFADVNTGDQTVIDFIAAATGPIVIALMIGFLPTIYGSYLNRETAVSSLSVTAGEPAWGPEMLSRTTLAGTLDRIGDEFATWADLAARMRMSHTMYPVLLWVRSARPYRHYVVSLLAVLDAASLLVSVTKTLDRRDAFRVLLQGGQTMEVLYSVVARKEPWHTRLPFVGRFFPSSRKQQAAERKLPGWNQKVIAVELASDQDAMLGLSDDIVQTLSAREGGELSLTRKDFDDAVDLLRRSGFPVERDLDAAWNQFRAARLRYEYAAYALCDILDATPAPWTGSRRIPTTTVWPHSALDLMPEADAMLIDDSVADDSPHHGRSQDDGPGAPEG